MSTFKNNKIIEEAKDLSKYGKEFQLKLLCLLIRDRSFSLSIIPIIKTTYFSDIYLVKIFSCVKEYISKYSSTPTFDNIRILIQSDGEPVIVYDKILKQIEEIGLEDRDFIIDNTRNFCFTKFALGENEKILSALKEGNFELAQKISVESFRFSGTYTSKIYDIHEDHKVIHQSEKFRAPIPLPFETFNKNTKGGIGSGDLTVIVAPSNFGKSAALTAIARHANVHGKNVAYFSYEMGHESVFARYIAGLLDIPQEELNYNEQKIDELFKTKKLGLFKLIQERATTATVPAIATQLEYLKSIGFFPDLVCVDALNQLKAPEGKWYKDDNAKFEAICEQLRDLANELSIPFVTACQTNRAGFSSDFNDHTSIGKAIEIFQVADVLITFSQKPELEERQECVALLLKNRHGKKNIPLLCHYDPNKGIFIEKEVLNGLILLSSKEKQKVATVANTMREKLKTGVFDKKQSS